jgi:serine/threonine protein kinase
MSSRLNAVEERLDTHTSVATDLNLSPRTRIVNKLQKKIRLNFQKLQQPPETLVENYKIGKVMGKGAFGKVNLAIHRLSGKFVALKSINKQFMNEEASKRKVM